MEEKERYVFKESTAYELLHILDTKTNEKMRGFPYIVKILNKQDREIKKLNRFNELVKENKKLKQSQKQIIISILEDIMTHCRYGISDYWSLHCVCTIIENEIKELEKKE